MLKNINEYAYNILVTYYCKYNINRPIDVYYNILIYKKINCEIWTKTCVFHDEFVNCVNSLILSHKADNE